MEEKEHMALEQSEERSHMPIISVVALVLLLAALLFFISTDREDAALTDTSAPTEETTVDFFTELTTDKGNAGDAPSALPPTDSEVDAEGDLQVD